MQKQLLSVLTVLVLSAVANHAGDAKATYDKDCARCHGADGKGQPKMGQKLSAKDYTDAKVQAALKDDAMAKAIKHGVKDMAGKSLIKPYEGISDEEGQGLVALIRSIKK